MYTNKDIARIGGEKEKEEWGRSPFRRDYGRLLHSPSFRRLQGKTQLLPGSESDFFRNRLTHSLEVAQIAKGIAQMLNAKDSVLGTGEDRVRIDEDLVEFAGLAHDLGHPPFGHNGERALDACMKKYGGFEGNAQTLRILTKVERKVYAGHLDPSFIHGIDAEGHDARLGLNLTYRSLAAILKYNKRIPLKRGPKADVVKGYYASEADIVRHIKSHVAPGHTGEFKTLECRIMDIADDIAYSTYDLEDAMKAGFTSPLDLISRADHAPFLEQLRKKITPVIPDVTDAEILAALASTVGYKLPEEGKKFDSGIVDFKISRLAAENSHLRTKLSSSLVHEFMMGISIRPTDNLAMASLNIKRDILLKIEALKHFTYLSLIMSPRLKVVEHRGGEIVTRLFETLSTTHSLLPQDVRIVVDLLHDENEKMRVICDFVAGMTDRYAVDLYNRLFGNAASLFVPL
ncbi:dNTP triphosphohydrolase [Acidovorax sp. SUPP2522]|uniref:dGTP triphosphohydrolase n=1 Tax=unclassified Acidovorax TaxID=2684926 RepID=UPI002349F3E7|nr:MULTISPECIES: dNTP triphosphohydrolase [unclassified Acidovorax]WCM97583.1 dNTP triphosphohydrolase [Acidovorax sp. GBBC 1281]GKT18919.1 dNTP triphosphohydrolase [Acidovorax sp. SUPP2522]